MTKSKTKYVGILADPMIRYVTPDEDPKRRGAQALMGFQLAPDAGERNSKQIAQRIGALMLLHDVPLDEKNWAIQTLWALAREYIPGFKFIDEMPRPKPKGAPKIWDGNKLMQLVEDVGLLKGEGKSLSNSFRLLTTSPRFKSKYANESPPNLKRRYYEALELRREAFVALSGARPTNYDEPVRKD